MGAHTYGYELEVGAVGIPNEDDPFGRTHSELGKASQTAVFRRVEDRPRLRPAVQSGGSPNDSDAKHVLLTEHIHHAHASAGNPMEAEEIRNRVKAVFSTNPTNELDVESIWVSQDVDVACGGSEQALISALLQSNPDGSEPEWEITEGGHDVLTWLILWKNWVIPDEEVSRDMWSRHELEDEDAEYYWPSHGEEVEEDPGRPWPEQVTVAHDWWPSPAATWESDTTQEHPVATQP